MMQRTRTRARTGDRVRVRAIPVPGAPDKKWFYGIVAEVKEFPSNLQATVEWDDGDTSSVPLDRLEIV